MEIQYKTHMLRKTTLSPHCPRLVGSSGQSLEQETAIQKLDTCQNVLDFFECLYLLSWWFLKSGGFSKPSALFLNGTCGSCFRTHSFRYEIMFFALEARALSKHKHYKRIFVYTLCLINISLSLSDDANKIKTLNIERA